MAPSRRSLIERHTPLPGPRVDRLEAEDDLLAMDEADFSDDGVVVSTLRLGGVEAEDLPSEESDEWGFAAGVEVIDRHVGQSFDGEDRADSWDLDEPESEEVRRHFDFLGGGLPDLPEETVEDDEGATSTAGLRLVALVGSGGLLAVAGALVVLGLGIGAAAGAWVALSGDPTPAEVVAAEEPEPKVAPVAIEPAVIEEPAEEIAPAPEELEDPSDQTASPAVARRGATPEPVADADPEPEPEPEPAPVPVAEEPLPEAGPPTQEGAQKRGLFGKKKKK